MNVPNMREAISTVYPYPRWTERVKWMSDSQVIAIYHKFLNEGKFDKKKNKNIKKEIGIQISIWDIMKGENK